MLCNTDGAEWMLGGMWNLRDHPIPWIFFTCRFDNEPADSHGSIFAKNFRQVMGNYQSTHRLEALACVLAHSPLVEISECEKWIDPELLRLNRMVLCDPEKCKCNVMQCLQSPVLRNRC